MQRWKWVVILIVAAGCSGPMTPILPGPIDPGPTPTPNNPPRIVSLVVSAERVEVGEQVTLTATVLDDETTVDDLKYEWAVPSGTIVGTGRLVKWTAPLGITTPAPLAATLTVVDRYPSGVLTLEHRVTSQSPQVVVEDSVAIVRAMTEKFLANFVTSSVTPETCIQDFTTSCRGRESERRDIVNNRANYLILSSKVSVTSATVNAGRTRGEVLANCEFTSKKLTDGPDGKAGAIVVATGVCDVDSVYENKRWWLCESSLRDRNTAGLHFIF